VAINNPPSYLSRGTYPAKLDRYVMQAYTQSQGVIGTNDLKVTQSGTPGMSVVVAAGGGFMQAGAAQGGMYFAYNDAALTLTVNSNSSGNPRVDSVVMYVRDQDVSGVTSNDVSIGIVAGTPASSPVAPTITSSSTDYINSRTIGNTLTYIVIANLTVANGATSIINANIADTRTKSMVPDRSVTSLSMIVSPIAGQVVWNTGDSKLYVYDGSAWQVLYPVTITGAQIASGTIVPTNMNTSSGAFPISISGNAATATTANSATTAGSATTASTATNAGYASTAGTAGNFNTLATVPYSLIVNNSNNGDLEVLSLARIVAPTGTPHMTAWRDSSNTIVAYVSYTGRVASTGTVIVLSDENEKHDIVVADKDKLVKAIDALVPKTFAYNNDPADETHLGFIAQDVQKVLPLAVTEFDDGRLGLSTDTIVTALVAKVQQLEARLAAIEAK
jgi:hypothetical protein